MKICPVALALSVILCSIPPYLSAQEKWPWNRSIRLKGNPQYDISLDTLSGDTLIENRRTWYRTIKSKENVELAKGSLYGGMGTPCGCRLRPHGHWIKRYRNGSISETGEYYCNRKSGTWTYYYENGNLKKYESYQLAYPDFLTLYDEGGDSLKVKGKRR